MHSCYVDETGSPPPSRRTCRARETRGSEKSRETTSGRGIVCLSLVVTAPGPTRTNLAGLGISLCSSSSAACSGPFARNSNFCNVAGSGMGSSLAGNVRYGCEFQIDDRYPRRRAFDCETEAAWLQFAGPDRASSAKLAFAEHGDDVLVLGCNFYFFTQPQHACGSHQRGPPCEVHQEGQALDTLRYQTPTGIRPSDARHA